MKTEYIVGIGEILWDMLPEGRRLGGAPANFAYHVSQFGLNSVAVSAVGRDEAGDAVIRELRGQCLHAGVLGFVHPVTGEYLEFCLCFLCSAGSWSAVYRL